MTAISTAKRFYKTAAASLADGDEEGSGYRVSLDGRPIRTPGGRPLILPTQAVAEAIAEEWERQTDRIDVAAMAFTRLAATAVDRVAEGRPAVIEMLLSYAGADALCYRAEEPIDLVLRQQQRWQPLLDWAAESLGARLVVTLGILPVAQPEPALAALRLVLDGMDSWELTALAVIAQACGSLVLALALARGRIQPAEAFALSQLDESYQIERWGEDAEAARRRLALHDDIRDAWRFMLLARGQTAKRAAGEA
ncbi:MAG: ATPase [Rhodospirillales bacterium]|jgi:chaperone required for assembly of F1-ATPase|nr:ATPase [Rhodospirillales bacterium]